MQRGRLVRQAREQADRGIAGRMEGHADMDMAVTGGSIWSRLRSPEGFTATSHYFVMDWASVWVDIAVGLLIAGRSAPAEAIQEWPFQQRRLAQIAGIVGTVVTFVITGIITRLILVRLGL